MYLKSLFPWGIVGFIEPQTLAAFRKWCHFFAAKALKGNEHCNEKKPSLRLFECLHIGNGYDICNTSINNFPLQTE